MPSSRARPRPVRLVPARLASALSCAVLLAGCLTPHGEASPGGAEVEDSFDESTLAARTKRAARVGLRRETDDWSSAADEADALFRVPDPEASAASSTPSPLVSIAASGAPLGTLLVALAREAGVELALHDPPDAAVTLALGPRPLPELLAHLAAQAPFHWRLDAGLLVVRGDAPFTETYAVDYLNLDRTTRGSVGLATRVGTIEAGTLGTTGGGAAGGGIANGSETRIESVGEHRFWESLARDVAELMAEGDGGTGGRDPEGESLRWSINRDAGLVTLRARPAAHERLVRYLDALHASAQRQVLIEASVIEVALSDSFEAGIDWRVIANGVAGLSAAQVLGGQAAVTAGSAGRLVAPAGLVSLVQRSGDGALDATLSLLERFGDVRILSRPRIIALNNQSSVLKVVDNRVYFTARVERRLDEDGDDEIVTGTEIHTVPVGLVMNVTPFIGTGGAVMLNVRPTLSRIIGFVDDPNPELALANVTSGVPEIQVREMESMLRVQSGEVAIIGGLMQEARRGDERRLPGLARLPIVGRLFTRASRERTRTELLIVLRPTVMKSASRLADRRVAASSGASE